MHLLKNKAKRVRAVKPRKVYSLLPPERRDTPIPGAGQKRTMEQRSVQPPNNEVPAKRTRPVVQQLDKMNLNKKE